MTDVSPSAAYRPSVVTFLDILGFREIVRDRSASEVRAIIDVVRRFGTPDPDIDAAPEGFETTASVAFSDSIVRVRAYDTDYPSGALFHEVISLVHLQAELIAHDVLVRGGVTVGNAYVQDDIAFGPAFNRAYELESKVANSPRIVLGPEVFQALRNDERLWAEHHDLADEVYYQRRMLKRGDDGLWYVDYLYAAYEEVDEPESYPELLDSHRAMIVSRAAAAAANPGVLQKYLWLAGYHNDVCARRNHQTGLIGRPDIPALEDLAEAPDWTAGGD